MKKGVGESRSRREHAKALEESKEPDARAKASVLAKLLRQPTSLNARELVRVASGGGLTTHDMQAGLAALIASAAELKERARKSGEHGRDSVHEHQRAHIVLLKQLVEGMRDVVLAAPSSGGPSVVVELHWPVEYAANDPGEPVRTKVPEGLVV